MDLREPGAIKHYAVNCIGCEHFNSTDCSCSKKKFKDGQIPLSLNMESCFLDKAHRQQETKRILDRNW